MSTMHQALYEAMEPQVIKVAYKFCEERNADNSSAHL
jgi:hypothetical protein